MYVAQGRAGTEEGTGRAKSADDLLPCADDLLSLMVLLLTRASVHYLSANATFMDHFLSLQTPFQHKGELGCVRVCVRRDCVHHSARSEHFSG